VKQIALSLILLSLILLGPSCSEVLPVAGGEKKLPIYSVERADMKVAISFDAAWGTEHTGKILDILDEYGIKTTFFVVKFWVETNPEMAREIVNRGHEIGNHSATHPEVGNLSEERVRRELLETHQTIYETTGFKPSLFRPPFGHYTTRMLQVIEELGYYTIQWDVDSLDWKERGVEDLVRRVTERTTPGSIVLFHNNARYLTQALPLILQHFQERGYEVVPVSELIYTENYYIDHQGRQRIAN